MCRKGCRLIFASHSSTGSPSGFSKDNLGLYIGESVSDKYQTFTIDPGAVAMAHRENHELWIHSRVETVVRTHWTVIGFYLKVNVEMFSQC